MVWYGVPLIAMTAFFSVLALDIAVPALVMSAMGLCRWLVLKGGETPFPAGRAV